MTDENLLSPEPYKESRTTQLAAQTCTQVAVTLFRQFSRQWLITSAIGGDELLESFVVHGSDVIRNLPR